MNLGFGNNVKSALAADITATQTVISVMPGTGHLFAALLQPDPALENHSHPSKLYAKVTLTDAQETVFEICHLTAVSADKLTVIRGQEGTTAKGWSLNNTIANFATRGSEDNFVQIEDLQSGHYLAATAGGTANALTVDLPSTFYLNGGNTFALHAPLLITPTLTNTGASTLMLTLSGHVVGTYPLVKGNNTALQAGDLVAKSPFMAIFNTDQNRFLVMNPTTEIGVVRSVNGHGPNPAGDVKLGTAADADVGTAADNVMAVGAFGLGRGANHKDDAYNNIGEIYRVNNTSVSAPGSSIYGVLSLPCDGGPSTGYFAASNGGSAWIGYSNTPANGVKWNRVYTTAYKPTATDTQAADWRNNFAAKMGIARVITGANKPTSPGVWSVENSTWTPYPYGTLYVTTNNADLSATPGNDKFIHYLFIAHGTGNKLFVATDVNGTFGGWFGYVSSKGGAFSGQVTAPNFASTPNAIPVGAGEYADQLSTQAPFFQPNWQWPVTSGGVFVPIAKGTSTRKDKGWPTAVSYGYLMPGTDMHAHPVIHALGDSGQECIWEFDTQTGGIISKAGEFATIDRDIPPGIIHAWPGESPPAGWLMCNGSGFSPSFCPRLATVFPSGQVPDLRGVFLRAKDNGKGYDPNRDLLSIQSGQAPASAIGGGNWNTYAGRDTGHTATTGSDNSLNYRVLQETEQQRETRPVNVAINYIVRAA